MTFTATRLPSLTRLASLAAAISAVLAATTSSTRADSPRTQPLVTALASEQFQGRLTGTDGERLASDYLVDQLQRLGAKPLPGYDYRLPFEFTAGTRDGGTTLTLIVAAASGARPGNGAGA